MRIFSPNTSPLLFLKPFLCSDSCSLFHLFILTWSSPLPAYYIDANLWPSNSQWLLLTGYITQYSIYPSIVGLDLIVAVAGRERGCNLDRSPVTPMARLESSLSSTPCLALDWGRKLEYPDRSHADKKREASLDVVLTQYHVNLINIYCI